MVRADPEVGSVLPGPTARPAVARRPRSSRQRAHALRPNIAIALPESPKYEGYRKLKHLLQRRILDLSVS